MTTPMNPVFAYPQQAAFGRVVPKAKLYQQANANTRTKALFVAQVDKITWAYKLAPATLNLPATDTVPEIQVLHIVLKGQQLHPDVLRCIDKAIPLPIVFELYHTDRVQAVACHKRPSDADGTQHVCSDYLASDWLGADTDRNPVPTALDLASLYQGLLQPLLPQPQRPDETLSAWVARAEQIAHTNREIAQYDAKIRNEKQFNRQLDLNHQRKALVAKLATLQT